MDIKNRLNLRHYLTVILGGLVVVLFFQNCGQAGQISVSADANKVAGVDGEDPNNPSPNDPLPVNLVYKDYMKDLAILEKVDKIDILVVVDNSGSMQFEQKNMADRFDTFIDQLQGLNWQVAITTTDVREDRADGALQRFDGLAATRYFMNSTDNLADVRLAFGETIQREEKGSGAEQGVRATYRALERALAAPNSVNGQFFRSGAALAVVVVTDADETPFNGIFTALNTPDELLSYVSKSFPNKAFSFHSIIVKKDDIACLEKAGAANEYYGLKYQYLSEKTGGIVGSVCEDDYGMQLKAMGQATADLIKAVTLECAPVDSDKDGLLDIKVRNVQTGLEIKDYVVAGAQVTFAQALAVGSYKFEYRCLVASAKVN